MGLAVETDRGARRLRSSGGDFGTATELVHYPDHNSPPRSCATWTRRSWVAWYVGTVRFVRDTKGSITGLTLNRSSARGVRFELVKRAG
jgi:hypothetical protein